MKCTRSIATAATISVSKLTDDFVRKYAEEKLDMVPAKNAQKKFISLSDGDKGEVVNDGKSDNIFRTIFDAFGM